MAQKKKLSPMELFDLTYAEFYPERWEALKEALQDPVKYVAWWNQKKFSPPEISFKIDSAISDLIHLDETCDSKDLYYLDYASAAVISCLNIQPGDHVLDLCAAPGGKSLGIALALNGEGRLVANDKSVNRRERLKKVFDDFLMPEQKEIVEVTGHDAGRWSMFETNTYDKILLDAPCSSERHYLLRPSKLSEWSPSRSKRLSKIQGTLLGSAFDALKVGGQLIYSTCSLSPLENDGLGEWLEKKRPNRFHWIRPELKLGEPTQYGHIFLPDRTNGHGPLFFMMIQKQS